MHYTEFCVGIALLINRECCGKVQAARGRRSGVSAGVFHRPFD